MKLRRIYPWILLALLFVALWTLKYEKTPGQFFRHAAGILGTFLIFGAEIFYTYRKEEHVKFGRLLRWLQTHIVIGLVGPAFILFHADFRFNGFAGFVLILTLSVVASGFFGRYIFRLIPKTIKGQAKTLLQLKQEEKKLVTELEERLSNKTYFKAMIRQGQKQTETRNKESLFLVLKSTLSFYEKRIRFRRQALRLPASERRKYQELKALNYQRLVLRRQIVLFSVARDLLRRWKLFHIPLTMTLFVTIIAHVLAVFYYGKVV